MLKKGETILNFITTVVNLYQPMVNVKNPQKNHSTKSLLLHLLKVSDQKISGSSLSKKLGVSRVAVWKAIHSLIEKGVPIEADNQGYRLLETGNMDIEDISFQGDLFFYNTTGSTMHDSRELKKKGKNDFLVIAEKQSKGRGRNRRPWNSPQGGIFMTLTSKMEAPQAYSPVISMEILQQSAAYFQLSRNVPVKVKWPNDLYLNGKKLGGLLVETETSGDRMVQISLGLGLNVNNPPTEESISLKGYSQSEWNREELISRLVEIQKRSLAAAIQGENMNWNQELLVTGSGELQHFNGKILSGEIEGVDTAGKLLFRHQNILMAVSPGECEKLTIKIKEKRK